MPCGKYQINTHQNQPNKPSTKKVLKIFNKYIKISNKFIKLDKKKNYEKFLDLFF